MPFLMSHRGETHSMPTRPAFERRPVFDALIADLKRSSKLFMDERRAPVLDPGSDKTKTGYFWALARDDRPWGGNAPPGVAFTYAPGRSGQYAEQILQGFNGILQVHGYAGYNRLVAPDRVGPNIQLAYCWAHARRKLIEITRTGSSPIAEEGVKRIGELYKIEAELRGLNPEARLAVRQAQSKPLIIDMQTWLAHHRARVSAKAPLGEALKYVAKYWDGLCLFLSDGRVELDNNSVERTIRPIALSRKNALFAGNEAGAHNWATIASLIETCKLNSVDPQKWLTSTLTVFCFFAPTSDRWTYTERRLSGIRKIGQSGSNEAHSGNHFRYGAENGLPTGPSTSESILVVDRRPCIEMPEYSSGRCRRCRVDFSAVVRTPHWRGTAHPDRHDPYFRTAHA